MRSSNRPSDRCWAAARRAADARRAAGLRFLPERGADEITLTFAELDRRARRSRRGCCNTPPPATVRCCCFRRGSISGRVLRLPGRGTRRGAVDAAAARAAARRERGDPRGLRPERRADQAGLAPHVRTCGALSAMACGNGGSRRETVPTRSALPAAPRRPRLPAVHLRVDSTPKGVMVPRQSAGEPRDDPPGVSGDAGLD